MHQLSQVRETLLQNHHSLLTRAGDVNGPNEGINCYPQKKKTQIKPQFKKTNQTKQKPKQNPTQNNNNNNEENYAESPEMIMDIHPYPDI